MDVDSCQGNCEDMFEGDFLWGLKAFKCNNLANRSVPRAAQIFQGLNFQTPTWSLAQNMTVYQVWGPLANVLPHCQKPEDAHLRPFKG